MKIMCNNIRNLNFNIVESSKYYHASVCAIPAKILHGLEIETIRTVEDYTKLISEALL